MGSIEGGGEVFLFKEDELCHFRGGGGGGAEFIQGCVRMIKQMGNRISNSSFKEGLMFVGQGWD